MENGWPDLSGQLIRLLLYEMGRSIQREMMQIVMTGALIAILITAIWIDLRSSRIPNWLTLPTMVFALATHAWLGGTQEALFGLAGLGTGFGLFFALYVSAGIGAGDVKLMGTVGAMLGPSGALLSGALAILVGGAYAAGIMLYQSYLSRNGFAHEEAPLRLRYGIAIAGGTLLVQLGFDPSGA
jgi:prepilin peptidase CpaA